MPNQRDVFLAPFPFSDEAAEKKRPVLVFSSSIFNSRSQDVLIMAITSNLSQAGAGIDITGADLEAGSLPVASRILPHKIYTLAQSRLEKFYCRLHVGTFAKVISVLEDCYR
jgi:mRNA interferase MazF